MKVSIIGAGYVGLSTGLTLASLGNEVYFVDVDEDKINKLRNGKPPFQEPHVKELLEKNLKEKRVKFSSLYSVAIPKSDVIFVCVGTPSKISGEADISHVKDAIKNISKNLDKKFTVVVIKSTVPVGTAKLLKRIIERADHNNFSIVSNPEFLREGYAIRDTLKPDRIVLGVDDKRALEILSNLYDPIIKQSFENIVEEKLSRQVPVVVTSNISAELIKYAANAFLVTKISFINEIANVAENIGGDIEDVAEGIGLDPRIGNKFLNAGLGWGGNCFPKDIRALYQVAGKSGYMPVLLKSVIEVNNEQRYRFLQKIVKVLGEVIEGKTVAILGIAFKSGTDDVRESPAIEIINKLLELGAKIKAYDPLALENAKKVLKNNSDIIFCTSPYDAANGASALVITTEWPEFKDLNFKKIKGLLKSPIVVDGKNLLDKDLMREMGFKYHSIGRK